MKNKSQKTISVKFGSQREFAKAMLDERKFTVDGDIMYYCDEDGFVCNRGPDGEHPMSEEDWEQWDDNTLKELVESEWYDELDQYPQGILCSVGDFMDICNLRSSSLNLILFPVVQSGTRREQVGYSGAHCGALWALKQLGYVVDQSSVTSYDYQGIAYYPVTFGECK